MSLTANQIELIKATVPVLRENGVALTSYFYNRMLTNHPELKEVFNLGHQRSGAQARSLANAVLAYAENIENPAVLLPAVELMAHKHVSLDIQAPDYDIVGSNLLHSISEVLQISMDDPLIEAWKVAYHQLAEILISTEKAIYDEHQQTKGSWLGWRKFKIAKKVEESSEITSFYLQPTDGGDLPTYKVGQYISVRVFVPELGLKQPRQYTLSDNPKSEYLRISVKREDPKGELAGGWVSTVLHGLNEGEEIEATAPTGNFFLIDSQKPNVFISGGVGLTPMIAMLNQLVEQNVPSPVSFIHACRNADVHAMKNHVNNLKVQYSNVSTFTVYEEEDPQADATGHLNLSQIPTSLLPKEADYYLCGPLAFMQAQYQSLVNLGVPTTQIHLEAFNTGGVALN
ncbi:nitric oxide dioxygenase [Mergibacter septicus]|uniref:Flavohemoprotein n=1 Tax=Mergibacter septicus TaxID=221402 RepID=A0A8D4LJ36_9PAST|nr:NO-inducible flavohemoprotein [Mergibacter septicus]AWX15160.1 nitric oxide dioxygenase [Mergibacter septicus]QDJ14414.1 nitric oxide dioxygenase [Mergibacter septicus]UTU48148.1 NO-inducible flavohemoprotein [Mergibacter septicus]WMR96235.1 NO-inducible flavohemoprotein [Mergibacter septicus]